MDKKQARKQVLDYFKRTNIMYDLISEGRRFQNVENVDTLYFAADFPMVEGMLIETSLRFREEHVYCQSYYDRPLLAPDDEDRIFKATRIINHINRNLCYENDTMFERTLILDESSGDIFIGTMIRYELLEKFFDDAMSYILDFQVQYLSDIFNPLFSYICKEGTSFYDAAVVGIDNHIMGKPLRDA